jgi:hypothetical protein
MLCARVLTHTTRTHTQHPHNTHTCTHAHTHTHTQHTTQHTHQHRAAGQLRAGGGYRDKHLRAHYLRRTHARHTLSKTHTHARSTPSMRTPHHDALTHAGPAPGQSSCCPPRRAPPPRVVGDCGSMRRAALSLTPHRADWVHYVRLSHLRHMSRLGPWIAHLEGVVGQHRAGRHGAPRRERGMRGQGD